MYTNGTNAPDNGGAPSNGASGASPGSNDPQNSGSAPLSALHQLAGAMNPDMQPPSSTMAGVAHSQAEGLMALNQAGMVAAGLQGFHPGHDNQLPGFDDEDLDRDPNDLSRKPGSGRPAGVQCKCKCCGAQGEPNPPEAIPPQLLTFFAADCVGFYRRSCGRKHRCLTGKCGPGKCGPGNMGPDGIDPEGDAIEEAPTMYQVNNHFVEDLKHL